MVRSRKRGFNKALFFIFGALALFVFFSGKQPVKTEVSKPTVQISASPVLSPKPTQKPTPTPNYGYCLYVPVLYYHHIQPTAQAQEKKQLNESVDYSYFDKQMAYLNQAGYTSISALDLVSAVKNHTQVPTKSIVITLDDGYIDQYTYAFPIAKKYNIRLNLLISSGLINNDGFMSWDQIREIQSAGGYLIDHTWSHNSVNYSSVEKIKYEIETAKTQIEEQTRQKVEVFGYPYGGFNNTSVSVLTQDGFVGAFSTIGGYYQCDSFIMSLHRNRIGNAPLSSYGL